MPDALQQRLADVSAKDRTYIADSAQAAHTAEGYHAQAATGAPPSEGAIRDANAMRSMELGEAYGNLVKAGVIKGDTVLFQADGHNVTANDLIQDRYRLAHPQTAGGAPDSSAVIYENREALTQQLKALQAQNPGNHDVASAMDAVEHISGGKTVSPTAWRDAENFEMVESARNLNSMSASGKITMDAQHDGLYTAIKDRRNELAHDYAASADKPGTSPATVAESLDHSQTSMQADQYRSAITGGRPEPEVAEIVGKWVTTQSGGGRIANYPKLGQDIILKEMTRLAKSGASVQQLRDLDDALQVNGMNAEQTAKYMKERFPDGLSESTRDSLNRLDSAAKNDYNMQRNGKADTFSNVEQQINTAHQTLADPTEQAKERLVKTLSADEPMIKKPSTFIRDDVSRRGYNAEQIDTVGKEIGPALKKMARPGGLNAEEIKALSPETRAVLTDIAEGIQNNEKKLMGIPPEARGNILANAGRLAAEPAAANGTAHSEPERAAPPPRSTTTPEPEPVVVAPRSRPITFPGQPAIATASAGNNAPGNYPVDGNTALKPQPAPPAPATSTTPPATPGKPANSGMRVAYRNPNPPTTAEGANPPVDANGKPANPAGLHVVKPGETPASGKPGATVPEEVPGGTGAGVAGTVGAVQAAGGINGMIRHGSGLGKNTTDDVGFGLGAANTAVGGASVVKAVAPELLSKSIMGSVEKFAWPLMVAQGVYDISTAKPEDRGRVATETVAGGATAGIMMGVVGGTGGAALAIVAPIAITYGIEKEFTLDKLGEHHQAAMNGITVDKASASHLQAEANRLQETINDANFGETLSRKNGRIDLNDNANLEKIKAGLTPDQVKQLHDDAKKHFEAHEKEVNERADQLMRNARLAGPQEYEELANMRKMDQAYFDRLELQSVGYNIQMSTDERDKLIGHDKNFVLRPDGSVDLSNQQNRDLLRSALAQESDAAGKVAEDNRIGNYPQLVQSEDKIRTNYAATEEKKRLDTSIAEINQIEHGTTGRADKTADQLNRDADQLAAEGKSPVAFTVTANRKFGEIQNFSKATQRDLEVPPEIAAQYEADPKHNQTIKQVIYKDDGHGNQVPDQVVIWKFNERDLNKAPEDPALSYNPSRAPAMKPDASPSPTDKTPPQAQVDTPASPEDKARQQAQAAVKGMTIPVQYSGDQQTASTYIPPRPGAPEARIPG